MVGFGTSNGLDNLTLHLPKRAWCVMITGIYCHVIVTINDSLASINVGKSGFASHTKHTVEATNTDLLHS